MNDVVTIIVTALGSGAFFGFIQFLISRYDGKHKKKTEEEERLEKIEKKMEKQELDNVRLQLLFLLQFHSANVPEIMKCAQHYFEDLNGDWYMTTIFNNFLKDSGIAQPEWFSGEKD